MGGGFVIGKFGGIIDEVVKYLLDFTVIGLYKLCFC